MDGVACGTDRLRGGGDTDRQIILLGGPLLEDGVALEEVDWLEVEA